MRDILILEDQVIIALSIQASITRHCDAKVHMAHDSATAFEIAHHNPIDLLITDIDLGEEIDGIDVAHHLHTQHTIPILFLTSYSDEQILKRASNVKMSGYLLKPFREDGLITQLRLISYQDPKEETHFMDLGKGYSYRYKTEELRKDHKTISLTDKEHKLFLALLNAKGNLLTYSFIDDLLWPGKVTATGVRRQLIYRLKKRISELSLESITDIGYRLNTLEHPVTS